MKTKHIFAFVACLLGAVALHAAGPGETCSTAIPLGKDYTAEITGPQTIWYSAWTFDLPLAVYFMPENETDPAPEIVMDFTCSPGVYSDPIISSLTSFIVLPYKITEIETDKYEGKFVYVMSVGKKYRDILYGMGVDYNVEVFVQVTYKSKGSIGIAPDNMFSSCMDGAKFMHYGDTIPVKANDFDKHVIVPYVQWKSDSIYYKWLGSKPMELTVCPTCKYDPTIADDERVLQRKKIQPGDSLKVTSEELKHYVEFENNEAGMFFAKFNSAADGLLVVNKVPQAPPRGEATLLQYDKITEVPAKSQNALFAIHKSWNIATKITASTNRVFKMYIGTDPDFDVTNAVASYQFLPLDGKHWLGIQEEDMKALWKNTNEQYLYVRFDCTSRASILPTKWEPSDCISKWTFLPKGDTTLTIAKGTYSNVYRRFYYNHWRGGDMTLVWNSNATNCPTFIGNSCDFEPDEADEHVIINKTISKKGEWVISADEIESWEGRTDPDGYLYLLCSPNSQNTMVITTTAPDETDPFIPRATIHVDCAGGANNFVVSVSEAQHISITGISGTVDEWDAVPGESHALTLPSGQYLLKGAKDEITIQVP